MAQVKAIKIQVSAMTASFRVPHIMIGCLPTYKMPPPATIYGYLAGALGYWFDPKGLLFAYTFTYQGVVEDLESAHIVGKSSGTLWKGGPAKNLEGNVNPQRREFLFRPNLTLYLTGPKELISALSSAVKRPQFASLLGRSQDLATCLSVDVVELSEACEGFFSDTILPWSLRPWVIRGMPVMMPRVIDNEYFREPVFERYIQLDKVPLRVYEGSPDVTNLSSLGIFYVDKTEERTWNGRKLARGIIFHEMSNQPLSDIRVSRANSPSLASTTQEHPCS